MKHLILVLLVGLAFNVFAQDEKAAVDYNNEGVAAYKAKDFKTAYEAFGKAIELYKAAGEEVGSDLIYNTGYCAYKAKKFEEAIPYFQQAMETGYKESKPYQMVAVIQYKSGKIDEMIETCTKGLEKYTTDAKLKNYAAKAYLKKGLGFFNAGNKIKKAANESGLNVSDPDKFNEEYAKADEEFKKALPFFEKAYKFNAKDAKILKALNNVYTNLDMADKAEKVKSELNSL